MKHVNAICINITFLIKQCSGIEIWLSGRVLASLPYMHKALDAQDLIPSMALGKGKKNGIRVWLIEKL